MTGPEKRYFKLFTARRSSGTHKSQLVLFDAIDRMSAHAEDALLSRSQQNASPSRSSTTKNRLYETILRSLSAYHAERSIDARLGRVLHQVEILHAKALYDDAERLLASVRKLAHVHNKAAVLIAVQRWDQRLLERNNYAHATAASLASCLQEGLATLRKEQELMELWNLKSKVFTLLYREGQARVETDITCMQNLLDHPLLRDPVNLHGPRAHFLFHHLHAAAAYAMGDRQRSADHLHQLVRLLDNDRDQFRDEPNLAFSALSNLIFMKVSLGSCEEAIGYMNDLRLLPSRWNMPETEDLDLKLFITTTSVELTAYARMGRFDKAMGLLPSVEQGLVRHDMKLGAMRKAAFYYQMAYVLFGAGRSKPALRWTHKLLNDIHIDDCKEIVCFGRILHLLAHIDADKLDALPYALRNTHRFLATRARLHRFEPLVLDMVRRVMKARNTAARNAAYTNFLERATPLELEPFERVVFDHLDPIAWAESKLTGRNFAELVQERAGRKSLAA